jgi:hypothetical protein
MKIALVGPDGAGKTSVARQLQQMMPQADLVYAGKSGNHRLPTTRWAYQIWQWSKRSRLPVLPQLIRFFLFYPLEFVENLVRFRRPGTERLVIYDRHPVDRMIMVFEYENRFLGNVPRRWLSQYPLLRFYNWWHLIFFPPIERLYFLLPEPQLCWERADGHYKSVEEAAWKIEAYRRVVAQLAKRQVVQVIEITPALAITDVAARIFADINESHLSENA